jgi:hypothetical protein
MKQMYMIAIGVILLLLVAGVGMGYANGTIVGPSMSWGTGAGVRAGM